jgi:hypothetical protein
MNVKWTSRLFDNCNILEVGKSRNDKKYVMDVVIDEVLNTLQFNNI